MPDATPGGGEDQPAGDVQPRKIEPGGSPSDLAPGVRMLLFGWSLPSTRPTRAGAQAGPMAPGVAESEHGQPREADAAASLQVARSHWMTSSARSSTDWGIVRPSALAV